MFRFVFALTAAGATSPCTVVPPSGEYYAIIGPGKYLYMEIAEDSTSFRTSLGDYAETTSDEDSEEEETWVKGSPYLSAKVDFTLKPSCKAEIATSSYSSYYGLLRSLSTLIRICIHPGGLADMVYDAEKDTINLGCLTLYRAVGGVVDVRGKQVVPRKDKWRIPRGNYAMQIDRTKYFVRIVDRSTVWIKKMTEDGKMTRVSTRYEIRPDGGICIKDQKNGPIKDESASLIRELKDLSGDDSLCMKINTLTVGKIDFVRVTQSAPGAY